MRVTVPTEIARYPPAQATGFHLAPDQLAAGSRRRGPDRRARILGRYPPQRVPIDARIASLTRLRHHLATVAQGDAASLMTDPDGRFLADFLAAAPEPEGPSA